MTERGKGRGAWSLTRARLRRFPAAAIRIAALSLAAIDRNRRKTVAAVILIVLGVLFWRSLPDPLFRSPYGTVVEARDGRLLGARIAADGQWRFPEAPCPERFARAAMAFEDGRFLWHPGIDPLAIFRAMAKNAKAGKVVSGASTLTMQVIRLSRPGKPRTLWQKGIEALLALRLELAYGKQDILALYAAHAPFGGNVVGLPAASWRYFGRGPESLSWAETALLAVLPNSPSLMHPGRNREPLRQKRDRLLLRLWHQGAIDSLTSALARLEPLPEKPRPLPRHAPHLLQTLASGSGNLADRSEGSPKASTNIVGRGTHETLKTLGISATATNNIGSRRQLPPGSRRGSFRTTLDYDLQVRVNEILARRQGTWEAMGIRNAAVLILHTPTGEALAYCGNLTAADSVAAGQQVDVVVAPRSTGSLLKPFLYAAMLEAGEILPASLVPDVPTHIAGFTPENFDRAYEGAVPAKLALARSLNVPAVRMLKDHGIGRFLHTLRALGLASADRTAEDYGLTLVLGGGEGTLWELTGMYAGLAREAQRYAQVTGDGGTRRTFFPPRVLSPGSAPAAGDDDSRSAPATRPGEAPGAQSPSRPQSNIGPAAAWFALQAMAEVSRPDAEQHWRSFASSRWVAWKTGTSFGFRDAWAVGVTPEFTVGVWVGNASGEGRPGMTGIQVAAPVLFEAFNLLPATTEFAMPMATLARIAVCARSGMRPSPHCPPADTAYVPAAGLRTAACPFHRLVHLDARGEYQVHDGCESVSAMRHEPWFVLPPAQEWFYRRRHGDYLPVPPWRSDCAEGAVALRPKAMDLLYPRAGADIYVPIGLDARKGRTVFEAVHREPGATVFWHLDDTYLGQTREFHKWAIDPPPGRHVLLLVDDRGERLERTFEVMARAPK